MKIDVKQQIPVVDKCGKKNVKGLKNVKVSQAHCLTTITRESRIETLDN